MVDGVGVVETEPSADLARTLAGLDRTALSYEQQLAAVAAWERVLSWATAMQNDLLADVSLDEELIAPGLNAQPSARWVADRVGVALGISGPSAQRRMNQAVTLTEKLPAVTAALRSGVITVHHARVAAGHAGVLDVPVAQAVDRAVMADPQWRTPSQLERAFAQHVHLVDPEGAARRHQAARRGRRVSARNEPDGMSSLWALLPAESTTAIVKKVEAHARSSQALNTPGDLRTLDERRADALVDLILRDPTCTGCDGTSSDAVAEPRLHGKQPEICVTVAMSTLIGADDAPANLEGYGWIDATTARRIAADPNSVWRRLLIDPPSGRLLDYGRDTYRPPQDLRDFVIARDQFCVFPTCDRPATACDLDHHEDWNAGGDTCPDTLGPLYRRHHRLKHEGGWHVERDPDTGTSIWTDPGGDRHEKPAAQLPTPRPVEPPALGDPPF